MLELGGELGGGTWGISYELPSLNQISSSARLDWRQEFGLFIGLISRVSLTSCPCLILPHAHTHERQQRLRLELPSKG